MRLEPHRLVFEIDARDGDARTGVLKTPHGDVATPAFVPLATRGSVKGLLPDEVRGLGYEMVLGNTYHLMLAPGGERIAEFGGLHGFMDWEGAIITDSGGFQVFSLAHGGVADEVKGRGGRPPLEGGVLSIGEEGVRFRSYIDGDEHFLGPERSMEVQAKLGSDIALAFDECTPFHADRDYTARSMERTHRWLDRCLDWHDEHGPARQAVFGIVQGGVYEDLRSESAAAVSAARRRRPRDRRHARPGQGGDARGARHDARLCCRPRRPSTCSGSARLTISSTGSPVASTSSTARSRPGSAATASRWRRCPRAASASTSATGARRRSRAPSSRAARARPARG